jgi:periplasmic protein CpxP/Spy
MRHNFKLILASIVAITSLASISAGCHRRHPRTDDEIRTFATDHVKEALDDLAATAQQREAVLAGNDRILNSWLALRKDTAQAHRQLLEEWLKDAPDGTKVHALVDTRIDAVRAAAHQTADELLAIHNALTPEQRAKIAERLKKTFTEQ